MPRVSVNMLTDVGSLQLWLLSEVLCMTEGQRHCSDELNICYEFNTSPWRYNDADWFCHNRNGTMATILDKKTQSFMTKLLRSEYWIGGELVVMDQWTWVDGSHYPGQ